MHTFGFPVQMDEIKRICDQYNISLVEDAAESLGSLYMGKHTGSISKMSAVINEMFEINYLNCYKKTFRFKFLAKGKQS